MTGKTAQLLSELTLALYEKKAILIIGNTGVGKTYIAKQVIRQLEKKEYSDFPDSSDQSVKYEIIPCHNSVSYEDIVGGVCADTKSGKLSFGYKNKILVETIIKASDDYKKRKGTKYVLLFDDLQRNELSALLGDAISAVGTGEGQVHLNSRTIDLTPNFYIIGTYNPNDSGAIQISPELLGKFYIREVLSDIQYMTEQKDSENAVLYSQIRSLVLNYLDIQYKTNTYEQNRYLPGHGYFQEENTALRMKYQLLPLLKQYVSEGILENVANKRIRNIESAYNKQKMKALMKPENSSFSDYRKDVTPEKFLAEDATSVPLENLIGRIIDQSLLTNDEIKANLLFNVCVCYREKEVGGTTYQAQLLATNQQYEKIRRGGSDRRKLYNGGTLKIDDADYHFTGGMQPKEYTVRNPRRNMEIWDIVDGYEIGESTSPNVILYRIVWQYYKTIIDTLRSYLLIHSNDSEKRKLLEYVEAEWTSFLSDFKEIRPQASTDANIKAEFNKEANKKVRELISNLSILWSNPGDLLMMPDGTQIILEGVNTDMNKSDYDEYLYAMDNLNIRQMILQGPPGTSKTYSAKEFLKHIANDCSDEALAELQISDYSSEDMFCARMIKDKQKPEIAWDIVQFHPSYGYEDFIRGIKVSTKKGSDTIYYETVNKVLGSIAKLAMKNTKTKFFLIIDEINRANLATVFGELIYGLEYREESVATPYEIDNNNRICIPDNLYIIGTMNTADKSIGGIDYAIRRRFLFFEQLPDMTVIKSYKADKGAKQIELNEKACKLFDSVKAVFEDEYLSPEYRREDVQIGHTYFLVDSEETLMRRFEYQIIPILKEYYKDGIISFDPEEGEDGFKGFLNCIAGKINMTSQKAEIDKVFKDLIA